MKISLYIPCFNAEKTIGYCLDAVFSQSQPLKEVLVIDDYSTDSSPEIISGYPVKIIRHTSHRGLSASRNTAIKNTDSQYVASLDADCIPEPDWLSRLIGKINSPAIAGAGGRLVEKTYSVCDIWRSVHMKQHWGEEEVMPDFLFGSNTVFRREALLKAGLYNEEFRNNYEDVDICERIRAEGYAFAYEPNALSYHFRKDNIHSLFNNYWRWYLEYYRKEKFYSDPEKFAFKLKDNIGLANRYIEEDISTCRHQLVYLDFLLALHHSLKDFEYFMSQTFNNYLNTRILYSWLSLVELSFFCHYSNSKGSFPALIPKENALLQNFLALNLILGSFIQEKFKDAGLNKLLYKHLFASFCGITSESLFDKLLTMSRLHNDWGNFYHASHPNLNSVFLRNLSANFESWLNQLIHHHQNITEILKVSASETDSSVSCGVKGGSDYEVR